jgi:hypothetical protein
VIPQRLGATLGQFVAPHLLEKTIHRHHPIDVRHQHAEHRPLLGGIDRYRRPLIGPHLQRPQNQEVHPANILTVVPSG